ncbi:hypothetical protein EJB05_09935 [Eragrostis curvula]|uniref:Uncharacterized protein n=1 Tax=Eragrostis curvula TaxID=38414 RepID=A0A5J9W7V5_9POAL|nr:hypothetical protein EJB05_09935 [Eragrostis curvula]
MENSTEDLSSTATNHCSFSGAGEASEESGWTSYIDYFMETQRRQKEEAISAALSTDDVGSRSISQYSGDCGSSRLPALTEPSEASRRLRLKKEGRRKKMVVHDESLELQDTATSPMSSPKLIELRESDANHPKKGDARDEFSHYESISELAGCNNLTNNGANTTTHMADDDCAYENALRKKGLCLVSISTFHV